MLDLLSLAKDALGIGHLSNGYTLGVNDRVAAGQAAAHQHIHLIPRLTIDVTELFPGIHPLSLN
jgi:diadenosine tetraphosphate (Ap4A) HIT family hydrolase